MTNIRAVVPGSIVRDVGSYESVCGYCNSKEDKEREGLEQINKGMLALKLSHCHYQVRNSSREKVQYSMNSTKHQQHLGKCVFGQSPMTANSLFPPFLSYCDDD